MVLGDGHEYERKSPHRLASRRDGSQFCIPPLWVCTVYALGRAVALNLVFLPRMAKLAAVIGSACFLF